MSKLVFLFVCVAVFHLANALKCYQCEKEACEKDKSSWQTSLCSSPNEPNKIVKCLKHVYKDSTSQKETSSRGCVNVDKSSKEYTCDAGKGTVVSCVTCDSDLCNSAPGVSLSLAAVSGVVLALIVPKLFS